jgi:hypothetical protein
MPDMTIEVAMICPQWASNFQVEGSGDNEYNVTINPYDPPSCTCPAFKFSGEYGDQHCKHIEKVKHNGCLYHPQMEQYIGVHAWVEHKFDDAKIKWLNSGGSVVQPEQPCPGCGNPMIVVRVAI